MSEDSGAAEVEGSWGGVDGWETEGSSAEGWDSEWGCVDEGCSVDDWSGWDDGVDETVLVQILRESFQVNWCWATGSSDQVSNQGGQWTTWGTHGGGNQSRHGNLNHEEKNGFSTT